MVYYFEVREILKNLSNKNLNGLLNFSSQIRFVLGNLNAFSRIEVLNKSEVFFSYKAKSTRGNNKKVIINSFTEIDYED